jgi:metallophosphoesterase superfamily enzyme
MQLAHSRKLTQQPKSCCCLLAGNPLPPVVHKVIRQHDLAPGRLVVVGDLHGCLVELFQVLDAVKFEYGKDNLILVGDVCNKGPRSQEVTTLELPAMLLKTWSCG